MSSPTANVHELIAWKLDEYPYRRAVGGLGRDEFDIRIEKARQRRAERERYVIFPALLPKETESIDSLLAVSANRVDLQQEYDGLDWTLGVVDLRRLLAFQRRLVFDPTRQALSVPVQNDWPHLIALSLGARRSAKHHLVFNKGALDGLEVSLHSRNPDLQLRLRPNANEDSPIYLYGGSPFLEVAAFRGRWFLRDGYHRAYRLLQAGVYQVPAVVIKARTLEELGATKPWFFSEDELFAEQPPRVIDFLDETMVLRYERMALCKVIRIRVEEFLQPLDEIQEAQGEAI